jgi:translation initiation factor 4A
VDQKNEQKEVNDIKTTTETKEEEKGASEEKKSDEVEIESNWTEKIDSFDELKLNELLLRGIYGYGFSKPSPIQQRGILPLLLKRDTIAQVKISG